MLKPSTWPAGILTAALLLFGLWNGLRAARAGLDWNTLQAYGAPAAYILSSGIFWTACAVGLLAALIAGWRLVRRAGIGVFVLYWVWYWADRLFVQASPAPNLAASIVASILFLAIGIGLWFWPGNDIFSEERE